MLKKTEILKTVIFTIIIFLFFGIELLSQNWLTKIYDEREGLPSSYVYSVHRDNKGRMWFGHEKGLSCYDGNFWTHFDNNDGVPNVVLDITEYKDKIWIASRFGVYWSEISDTSDKVFSFHSNETLKNVYSNKLIVYDNKLFINSRNDKKNYGVIIAKVSESDNKSNINSYKLQKINEDVKDFHIYKDTLFILGINHLFTYYNDNGNLKVKKRLFLRDYSLRNEYFAFNNLLINDSGMYLTGAEGLIRISDDKTKLIKKWTCYAIEQVNENIWVSSPGRGVFKYNNDCSELLDSLSIKNGLSNSFMNNYIFSDFDNTIWIPTTCGVTQILSSNAKTYLHNIWIQDINSKSNDILVSYNKNISIISQNDELYNLNTDFDIYNIITSIKFNNDKIYLTSSSGIIVAELKKVNGYLEFKKQEIINIHDEVNYSRDIIFFDDKNTLIQLSKGLCYYNLKNKSKIFFFDDDTEIKDIDYKKGLIDNKISEMVKYKNGAYISTEKGIVYFDNQKKKITDILKCNKNIIINQFTKHEDKIMAATDSGIFVIKNDSLKKININNLKGNITALAIEGNYIYAGSERGLYIIYENKVKKLITEKNGLTHRLVKDVYLLNDYIWVTSNRGVSKLSKKEILKNEDPPDIYISLINYNKSSFYPISDKNIIHYSVDESFGKLSVYLTGNFVMTHSDYLFKMKINNQKPIFSKSPKFESILLKPGSYSISIQSKSDNSKWSEKVFFKIDVPKPIYMRYWFIALIIIFLIALIFLIIKIRTKNIESQNIILNKMVEERTKELQYANEKLNLQLESINSLNRARQMFIRVFAHDISNSIVNISRGFDLLRKGFTFEKPVGKSNLRYYIDLSLNRIKHLVKHFMIAGRIESDRIEIKPNNFDITKTISDIKNKLMPFLINKDINLDIEINTEKTEIFNDEELVTIVIDNIINNAIKYSFRKTQIRVVIEYDDCMEISIVDEGPGFKDTDFENLYKPYQKLSAEPTGGETKSGLGLWITKSLLEKIGGSINIKNRQDMKGAIVVITLFNK